MAQVGSCPHVSQKVFERITPSLAHLDPATAIPFVGLVFLVVATLPHAVPCALLRSSSVASKVSVLGMRFDCHLLLQMATRLRVTASKTNSPHRDGLAAVASA